MIASDTSSAGRDRLAGLDALRGWAACAVISTHALYFVPLTTPEWANGPKKFLPLGVPLFFVISAFTLAYQHAGTLDRGDQIASYAIRRVFRIAPLYYVMLLAWTAYDAVTGSTALASPTVYLLNLTFLFGLVPSARDGIVLTGWSIGVEMMFYALLPLLAVPMRSTRGVIAVLAAALVVGWWHNTGSLPHEPIRTDHYWIDARTNLPYFAFGLLAWRLHLAVPAAARCRIASLALAAGLALGLGMALVHPWLVPPDPRLDPRIPIGLVAGWGSAFGLIVLSQALAPVKAISNRVTGFLGTISFSLYLVHPLILKLFPVVATIESADLWPLAKMLLAIG